MQRPWLQFYDPGVPAQIEYPRLPVYQFLEEAASRFPQRFATNFYGRRLTYQQLRDFSDRLAASAGRLSLHPGDRAILLLPNCPQFVIAYYGLLKAGVVVVPVNPLYSERELTQLIRNCPAKVLFTFPEMLRKAAALIGPTEVRQIVVTRLADYLPLPLNLLQGAQEQIRLWKAGYTGLDFQSLLSESVLASFQPYPSSPEDTAVILFSGGTTGTPKGVQLSHANLVASAYQIAIWGQIQGQESVLAVLPFFHGFGMSINMNTAVLVAGEIVLMPRFKTAEAVRMIQKYRITFLTGVPTLFVAINHLPAIERYDLSSLKGALCGAAPLAQTIKTDFEAHTGGHLIEGYGLSEAVMAVIANPFKGLNKPGSIGVPLPDMDARIISLEDGHDLLPGEPGELLVRGPTVMQAYDNRPAETCQAIVDGWLYTGDIAWRDEDGYFYITDRKKDLMIVSGFNVFPREIEELIYKHPKLKEGVAVGLPDEFTGERIKVFITPKAGVAVTAAELKEYFQQNLAPFKVPEEIEFRAQLPKSLIGKILRRELRAETLDRAVQPDS